MHKDNIDIHLYDFMSRFKTIELAVRFETFIIMVVQTSSDLEFISYIFIFL